MAILSGMLIKSHPIRFGVQQPQRPSTPRIENADDLAQALRKSTSFSVRTLIQGLNQWVKTPQDARKVLIAHQEYINRSPTTEAAKKGYFGGGFLYDYNFAILQRLSHALAVVHSYSGQDGCPELSENVNQLLLKAFTGVVQEVGRDYIARVHRSFGGPYNKKHIIEPAEKYMWA
ncbi:MAG TPA: hypothetical protein V6C52_05665 [Coleofasciculaceae cyanobacterium]|jgi:hypothetical protein